MGLIRIKTVQGHPVPKVVGSSGVPWDPDLHRSPIKSQVQEDPDAAFPMGATAQNGMEGADLFRCNLCEEIVTEEGMRTHDCEG